MAEILMTPAEKDNLEAILDMAAKLPEEAQKQLYYISVGLAFGNNVSVTEEKIKENGSYSIN